MAARFFDESWYARTMPPEQSSALLPGETPQQRNARLKTHKYRVGRAQVPPAEQREEFFGNLVKKAEKAALRGDVSSKPLGGGGYKVNHNRRGGVPIQLLILLLGLIMNVRGESQSHFQQGPVFKTKRGGKSFIIGQPVKISTYKSPKATPQGENSGWFPEYKYWTGKRETEKEEKDNPQTKPVDEGVEETPKIPGKFRWARVVACGVFWVWIVTRRRRREGVNKKRRQQLPAERVGGAPWKSKTLRDEAIAKNNEDGLPIALAAWGGWCGNGALKEQDRTIEALLGQSLADSTRKLYTSAFHKWEVYRKIQGKSEYLSLEEGDARQNEDSLMAFCALHLGPLERD